MPELIQPQQSREQTHSIRSRVIGGALAGAAVIGIGGAVITETYGSDSRDTIPSHQAFGSVHPDIEPTKPLVITTRSMATPEVVIKESDALAGSIDMTALTNHLATNEKIAAKGLHEVENSYPVVPLVDFHVRSLKDGNELYGVTNSKAVTTRDLQTIYTAVGKNRPLIDYLMHSGKIDTIKFSVATDLKQTADNQIGSDGDMRMFSKTKQSDGRITPGYIDYVLPPHGTVSANAMATMIDHEATHLLERPIEVIDKFDPTEVIDAPVKVNEAIYAKYCSEIRASSIAAAERDPLVIAAAERVLALNKSKKGDSQIAETVVAKALLHGTFEKLQGTIDRPGFMNMAHVPEGRTDDTFFIEFGLVGENVSSTAPTKLGQLTPMQHQAQHELELAFDDALDAANSPFASLKESTYLKTSIQDGHPESNTSELLASSMNVMLSYPKQFALRLKAMPKKDRDSILGLLHELTKDTFRANSDNKFFSPLRTNITTTLAWVTAASN